MTEEELRRYDGKEVRAAYVAYKGVVYDVTDSGLWADGEHEGVHQAGMDLTDAMEDAPHAQEVFERFSVVGDLLEKAVEKAPEQPAADAKTRWREWYQTYHPHPAAAHFPIALHFIAGGMDIAFFTDSRHIYELAVFYAFLAATVFGVVAMVPGILSWWVNYNFSKARPFVVKFYVATLTLVLGIIAVGLHILNPHIAYESTLSSYFYHFSILVTVPTVIVLAYYGGKISWAKHGRYRPQEAAPRPARVVTTPKTPVQPPMTRERSNTLHEHETWALVSPAEQGETPLHLPSYRQMTDGGATLPAQRAALPRDDITIMIGGAAGSGIQSLEALLVKALGSGGYHLFSTKEYMSRIRGGSNSVQIRIASSPVRAAKWVPDLCIALDTAALGHLRGRIGETTLLIGDLSPGGENTLALRSETLKDKKYLSTYAAGILFGLFSLEKKALLHALETLFTGKEIEQNSTVIEEGYRYGSAHTKRFSLSLPKAEPDRKHRYIDGTTACGFGFLSGGCNVVASYPMSPSTGVLNFMAQHSKEFDIVIEQAEDEIAAFSMGLGAWYAGGRGLTTTSGGGFALMCENMSLSGMTETPMVVYLAQRPGPATGLPTRTEQGDLHLAVYAGHGDFPRIVLAPGDPQECIEMGALAFDLADRFQVSVVLLSDQYLADSVQLIDGIDFAAYGLRQYIVQSDEEYRRYALNESGISPRAVPGYGNGLVCCDSDEHDERGQITESYEMRELMVAKRHAKAQCIEAAALPPTVCGDGTIAVVGWGSTKGVIAEAVARLDDARIVQVHYPWVHPLGKASLAPLRAMEHLIVVENNANAQFSQLLTLQGINAQQTLLQSNGFAFFADELYERLQKCVKEIR